MKEPDRSGRFGWPVFLVYATLASLTIIHYAPKASIVFTGLQESLLLFYNLSFDLLVLTVLVFLGALLWGRTSEDPDDTHQRMLNILWWALAWFIWGKIWLAAAYDKIQIPFPNPYVSEAANLAVLALIHASVILARRLIARLPLASIPLQLALIVAVFVDTKLFWKMASAVSGFGAEAAVAIKLIELCAKLIALDIGIVFTLYTAFRRVPFLAIAWKRIGGRMSRREKATGRAILALNLILLFSTVGFIVFENVGGEADQPLWADYEPRRALDGTVQKQSAILIVVDSLRSDHMSLYGYGRDTTPCIDRFAQEAAVFQTAISPSAWTAPSVASLFTSTYMSQHGVGMRGMRPTFSPEWTTLAERMRTAGFVSAAFITNRTIFGEYGFAQGFDLYYEQILKHKAYESAIQYDLTSTGSSVRWYLMKDVLLLNIPPVKIRADAIDDKVIQWLDRNKDRAFFLYLHYMEPHYPYVPPPKWRHAFAGSDVSKERAKTIDMYDGEIAAYDEQFCRLLAYLEESGILKKSILIFTADHGEEFREHHGRFHAKTVYDEVIRVPLIIRFPNARHKGRYATLASGNDILPTLLDFFKVRYSEQDFAGMSLLPVLDGEQGGRNVRARGIFLENYYQDMKYSLKTYRSAEWKYILTEASPRFDSVPHYELYDLTADPSEQQNLIQERPDVAAALRRELDVSLKPSTNEPPPERPMELSEEEKRHLKALGYLQ